MSIKGILRGALLALIIAVIVLFGAAAAAYFGIAGERAAGIAVFAGAVIGVFAGAFSAAHMAGSKKLFNALSVSLIFAAVLAAAAYMVSGGAELHAASAVLLGSIAAAGVVAALFA